MAFLDPNEILKQQKNEENTKLALITPIIQKKWQSDDKILMEYFYTSGRISIDEYNVAHRGKQKKVDYLLLWKDNILLALVEAKGQDHSADEGYSQAIDYARDLDVPFAYATNGIELLEKDMITGINKHMKIDDFPTPDELWQRYLKEKGFDDDAASVMEYPYYQTVGGKKPRYYQRIAINRTVEHISKGNKRALLVMATGTGKTFTAFQIIYRFWKLRKAKKILFLADRNILVDQTMRKDFAPFTNAMDLIETDIASKLIKPTNTKYEHTTYTQDELGELLDAVKGTSIEYAVKLTAYYGFRRSEVLGLTWDCVDWEKNTIDIKQTLIEEYVNGKGNIRIEKKLKTQSTKRVMPLTAHMRNLLLEIQCYQEANKKRYKHCYNHENDNFVITDVKGNLFIPSNFTHTFTNFIKKMI